MAKRKFPDNWYALKGQPNQAIVEELRRFLTRYSPTALYPGEKHDDQQGVLGTALNGVTTWTPAQFRGTGIVLNNIQSNDVFSMVFQFSHRRKLLSVLDSVHLHYIPNAAANGNIRFAYTWGWYDTGQEIPNTLPNTGNTADIPLVTGDQYKLKISSLLENLTPPTLERYSSILLVKLTAAAPAAGTNWWAAGGTNTIALAYMDAHYVVDRGGSTNEYDD